MRPSELQIHYQRNMLFGLCMSLALSLGFGVWVRSLDGPADMIGSPIMTIPNIVVLNHDMVEIGETPAQILVGGMNPYAIAHEGFLGFLDLTPRPQAPEPITKQPALYRPDLAPLPVDATPSFSIVEGDEVGLFLPEEYAIADVRTPLTREVQVLHKIDPEYPFVAREAGKEGVIVLLVCVDSTGALVTFPDWVTGKGIQTLEHTVGGRRRAFNYAVQEDPPDWFFAANFLKVLKKWVFTARVIDGRPVSSMLRIKCRFCLGQGCIRFELEPVEG